MHGFTLLMKNYVNMSIFWWEILKPGRIDSIRDTGTVYQKSRQLECLQKQVTTNMTEPYKVPECFYLTTENKNSCDTFS